MFKTLKFLKVQWLKFEKVYVDEGLKALNGFKGFKSF